MTNQRIKTWAALKSDERGFVVSIELVLIAVVVLIGLIVSFSAARDAFIGELADIAGSVQDINQSYTVNGAVGLSATSAGMGFNDLPDADLDVAGAENCIVFDAAPSNPISDDDLVLEFIFDNGASDTTGNNDGVLQNGATVSGGVLLLDGVNDFVSVPNTSDINLGIHDKRTVTVTFNADDVASRQVLYEEGGTSRGLIIYIEDGELIVGGWNIPESTWLPLYASTPIEAGVWNTATLVLDGGPVVTADALTGYLNGNAFGSVPASQLWSHGGGIGIGAINGRTLIGPFGAQATGPQSFGGQIGSIGIYNRAVTAQEIFDAGGGTTNLPFGNNE